jgi:hypothetical protein
MNGHDLSDSSLEPVCATLTDLAFPRKQAKPRKDVGLKESATGRSEILSVPAFTELHEPEYTRNLLAGSDVSRRAMACFVNLRFCSFRTCL